MGAFRESRNVELSLIYYLETNINSDWTGVTVVKSFTNAYKAALPVVAVRLTDTINNRREVGSTTLLNDYILTIDIFASSDGLRIDLSDYILDKLKDGCIYYEHSQTSGAPQTLTRTAGSKRLIVKRFISNQKLDFGEDVDNYDKFRHFVQVEIRIE
jgi:hypothetical protein